MSPSIWQLLIVLAIVLLLFGAKRLRNIGTDLGSAVKGFKKSMQDEEDDAGASPDRLQGSDSDDAGFDEESKQHNKDSEHQH